MVCSRASQLARLEGLGQVVVGAEFQADHAVHQLAARGEHQHRHCRWSADRRQTSKPSISGSITSRITASKPPPRQPRQPCAGPRACCSSHGRSGEVGRQRRPQVLVVVDQQQAGA
jgi:hypothetical protein